MNHAQPALARRLWLLLEPLHAVTYFSPEPARELSDAGYRGFWMGYVAARSAPLGRATPDLVEAVFYNFSRRRIRAALPDAWALAPPEAALSARSRGATLALQRLLPRRRAEDLRRATSILRAASAHAPREGRALFAANAGLPEDDGTGPGDPDGAALAALWHQCTLLREHRGDGHVAVLLTEGISGRAAHVLHALTAGIDREVYRAGRDMEDQEWADLLDQLRQRGLVDAQGAASEAGRRLAAYVEERTDMLAATAYDGLRPAEVDDLVAILTPWAAAIRASGDIPAHNPIGMPPSEG